MTGKNLDNTAATKTDYVLAGVGMFMPFVSGTAIKNFILKDFRVKC
jgi:hypothetical protein